MTTEKQRYACSAINRLMGELEDNYLDRYGFIHISQEDLHNLVDEKRKEIRS
jgi:hypothetical protein